MSKRNKIVVAVIVGVLTVGVAFGAVSIANAHNGIGSARSAQSGQRLMQKGERTNGVAGRMMEYGKERMDGLAAFLGLDSNTLETERENGKSLAEIAQANGKTPDELKVFLENEFIKRADSLLKEGKITQQQYDNMKSHFEERINEMINRKGTGRPEWAGKGSNRIQNGEQRGNGRPGFHRGDCGQVNKP
jgi:hypothetical protein